MYNHTQIEESASALKDILKNEDYIQGNKTPKQLPSFNNSMEWGDAFYNIKMCNFTDTMTIKTDDNMT